jgi:hypothetical protein
MRVHMKSIAIWLKISILIVAALLVIATFGLHLYYESKVSTLDQKIIETRRPYLLNAKDEADSETKLMSEQRESFQKEADTLFDIFTHAVSVFGGLAFSALIDLTGLAAGASGSVTVPTTTEGPGQGVTAK